MKKIQKTKNRIRREKQDVIDGKIRPNISFSHSKVEEVKSRLKKELKEERIDE